MDLNKIGKIADQYWEEIPDHFPIIELGKYVVMPNHVHGILIIDNPGKSINSKSDSGCGKTIGQLRFQNQGKDTISAAVGSYKSAVSKEAHKLFPAFAWQARFHDHISGMQDRLNEFRIILRIIRRTGKRIGSLQIKILQLKIF